MTPAAVALAEPSKGPPQADVASLERDVEALRAEMAAQRALIEQQRQELESSAASVTGELERAEPALRLYGFMDMGYQRLFMPDTFGGQAILPTDASTFVLGNVNLYLDAKPSEDWRGLVEVRFTNYPNGDDEPGTSAPGQVPHGYARTSTTVFDVNNAGGGWAQLPWGSIVLERAHIDWLPTDGVNVRVGSWLTPFGIWNVDHGTPTLISMMLPQFAIIGMIPTRQLGVQIYGATNCAAWRCGYALYASNGRTPGQLDLTHDKMLGGRFVVERTVPFSVTLGLSALTGRYSDKERIITSVQPFAIARRELIAYHEQTIGLDASFDIGALRLRTEGLVRQVSYEQGKRDRAFNVPGFYTADSLQWDAYVLGAYRLPWWRLEPYAYLEIFRHPTLLGEGLIYPSVGVNVRFQPHAMLKLQYVYGTAIDFPGTLRRDQEHHTVAARVVLAF